MTAAPPGLSYFLSRRPAALSRGPVAIILIEDGAVVDETIDHHLRIGFRHILALSPEPLGPADADGTLRDGRVTNLIHDIRRPAAHVEAVNAVIEAVPDGTWLYYCFNAEFLFFPFSEQRSIAEMLAFHAEERRDAMLTYVIDLYAPDLKRSPDAVDLDGAMFDRSGYYALGLTDAAGQPLDRQLSFHGGLRWRFEEHLPPDRRRLDRIALFRARKGLRIGGDHHFNLPEYNTYSCPWHHNLTAAITSFRVAKALMANPGSRHAIHDFTWNNSLRFDWQAQQLMDLGLMEPGQWF